MLEIMYSKGHSIFWIDPSPTNNHPIMGYGAEMLDCFLIQLYFNPVN